METTNTKILKTIAHEFRTPLNTINGLIYSLADKELHTSVSDKLKVIKHCSDHLNNLVQNINEFCYDSLKPKTKSEPIEINLVLKKCKASYSHNINKNAILINSTISKKLYGNKKAVIQILNSIINNTTSYTNNGLITINAKVIEEINNKIKIRFTIEDSKTGVNLNQRNELYTNFMYIESKSKSAFNLSLFLLDKNIRVANGRIITIPNRGNSNAFIFDITLNTKQHLDINPIDANIISNSNFSILLAEDNKINQILTKKLLQKEGYNCDVASNGLEALEKVKLNNYDLILMDLMMPIMDGYEATIEIRKIKPNSCIIALTAISEISDTLNISNEGFNFVMQKPFEKEELYAIVLKYRSNIA